jgi:hypothetical protein
MRTHWRMVARRSVGRRQRIQAMNRYCANNPRKALLWVRRAAAVKNSHSPASPRVRCVGEGVVHRWQAHIEPAVKRASSA